MRPYNEGIKTGYSDADLVRAVQAERQACLNLVWLAHARHKAAEEECEEENNVEEAEMHKFEAMTLESLAREIEMRGGKAPA